MPESSTSQADYQPEDTKQQVEDAEKDQDNEPKVSVNVSADYEASKKYSVSGVDKAGGDQASTAKGPSNSETQIEAKSTGDPEDYRSMAKDVNPNL